MKTIAPIIRALVLATAILAPLAAEAPAKKVDENSQTLPISRVVTDTAGRKLDGTILSKTATGIKFRRTSDGKEFDLPLHKLAEEDVTFIKALQDAPSAPRPSGPIALVFLTTATDETIEYMKAKGIVVTLVWWNTAKEIPGRTVMRLEDVELADYDIVWVSVGGGDGGNESRLQIYKNINALNRVAISYTDFKSLSKEEFLERKQARTGTNQPYVKVEENFVFYRDLIPAKREGERSTIDEATQKAVVDEALKLVATYHR